MLPYERLDAWRVSHELTLAVYRATDSFPVHERYGITAQARRAACSVPTNIAEGAAKRGPREFRRYLDIALGSLSELSYLLMLARELGFLPLDGWEQLNAARERAGLVTWKLYRSLDPSARECARSVPSLPSLPS